MANEEVLGPRKTMFVLVIVVGCFAVLWPRILSPLILGHSRDQLKPNKFDREAGCCEVMFEKEIAVLELINEVCSSAVQINGKISPYAASECRKAVNETCGLDIAAFLKRSDNVGKSSRLLVETLKNSNGSCLKEHFGVPVWNMGTHVAFNSWTLQDNMKQERPPIRGAGPHPALRERGRAIPAGAPTSPSRGAHIAMPPHARVRSSPLSVYFELDIKPPPIPGMRPPLGSPGGPVPAPKSSMGFVMPIYTICIIVFFVYTLSKILFKRGGTPYEAVSPDPQFRRRVFRDDSRTSPDKLVVTAISGLVAEVQQQMDANHSNQHRQESQENHTRPYTNGTILHNTGPVHIVTSEYRESKDKSPEPQIEKDISTDQKESSADGNVMYVLEEKEHSPEKEQPIVEENQSATMEEEPTAVRSDSNSTEKEPIPDKKMNRESRLEGIEASLTENEPVSVEKEPTLKEKETSPEDKGSSAQGQESSLEDKESSPEEKESSPEVLDNELSTETKEDESECDEPQHELKDKILPEERKNKEIETTNEILGEVENKKLETNHKESNNLINLTDVIRSKPLEIKKDVEDFLKEQLEAELKQKQSTPDLLEEAIKDDEDLREDDKASVKVVGMEVTAHCADGGSRPEAPAPPPPLAAPSRPHEAEEVKSIYLETQIPQQSRVLVADFHSDDSPPARDSPMVVSGKMTLSLIQDEPRETPERDPESTVDDFTTASAVTQPAPEKDDDDEEEVSEEEIEEEIEVEEIEEEVEEIEEDDEEEDEPEVRIQTKK